MALTLDEAHAVNTLAHWLTSDPLPGSDLPTVADAGEALTVLVRGAHRKLMAGYSPQTISVLWPGNPGSPAASAREPEDAAVLEKEIRGGW